jgi:hypothetical protein
VAKISKQLKKDLDKIIVPKVVEPKVVEPINPYAGRNFRLGRGNVGAFNDSDGRQAYINNSDDLQVTEVYTKVFYKITTFTGRLTRIPQTIIMSEEEFKKSLDKGTLVETKPDGAVFSGSRLDEVD